MTREVDLIEEVARIDGLERLPATLPPRRGAPGASSHAQRVRRRAEDALAARGLSRDRGWSFADPGAARPPAARRRTTRCAAPSASRTRSRSRSRSCARRCSRRCSTSPPTTSRAARRTSRCSSRGPSSAPRADGPLAAEHHGLACSSPARSRRPSWRGEPALTADFFAAKGLLAGGARRARRRVVARRRRAGRSCTRAAPRAILAGERRIGFIGELHPLVAASWDLERVAAWARRPRRARRARAADRAPTRRSATFPAVREDLAVVVADAVAGRRGRRRSCAGAGGAELARVEVFDVYRGAQVGEGRVSLALHLEFRAADRTLTDEEVAAAARRDRAGARDGARRRAPWLSLATPIVVVLGASGFAGAIAARCSGATRGFELAAITAREDAGPAGSPTSTRTTACRSRSRSFDVDRAAAGRRGDRRLPARQPPRRSSPRCSSAACASSTSRPTSACATSRPTSAGTCPHPHPELIARAVYGLTELYREQIAGADARRLPGLLPDRGDPRARAARRGRPDRRRRDRRQDRRVGRRASSRPRRPTSSSVDENVRAYGVGAHRHMPEIDQELGALGAPVPITFTPHLRAARPGRAASPATSRRRDAVAQDELDALYARALRRRAVRRARRPPARASATCARPTSARSTSTPTSAPARLLVFAAIDNLWKGTASQAVANLNLMFGLRREAGLR